MTVDPEDEDWIRAEWALRDLWEASQKLANPVVALQRWVELTWAIYRTAPGADIGLGRCSSLAARVVADEVICGL